jgi:hypothetical protein
LGVKEFGCCFGADREKFAVYGNANTLLAVADAEGTCKLYLVLELVFRNKTLKGFNDLTRSFEMTRASDANSYFHDKYSFCFEMYLNFIFLRIIHLQLEMSQRKSEVFLLQ